MMYIEMLENNCAICACDGESGRDPTWIGLDGMNEARLRARLLDVVPAGLVGVSNAKNYPIWIRYIDPDDERQLAEIMRFVRLFLKLGDAYLYMSKLEIGIPHEREFERAYIGRYASRGDWARAAVDNGMFGDIGKRMWQYFDYARMESCLETSGVIKRSFVTDNMYYAFRGHHYGDESIKQVTAIQAF